MASQSPPKNSERPDHASQPGRRAGTDATTSPIVGVGASAGGLEAFSELLEHLPADTGFSLVFVQHLDPHHESILTELVQQRTSMKVQQAANNMPVEPNCVYVIPPNTSLEVQDHTLRLSSRMGGVAPMPIDFFFRSLATDLGAASIGVVLSGSASDGTLGLKAIKGEGGITFAQDPASAAFDGMPRSAIFAGCVDFVLPPSGIAQELVRISRHPYVSSAELPAPSPEIEKDFAEIFNILRNTANVDFSLYKHGTIRRRIFRRMALHKIQTPGEYVRFLRERRKEAEALFQDLLISVTSFFREPATFQALHDRVFPSIFQNRGADDAIRVWVPGCSTGEEVYSIAIALVEYTTECGSNASVQIFGTDLSEPALDRARTGIYPDSISADVSPERLHRFFAKVNGHYQIVRAIRDMCVFARQNLTKDPPFSHLDLLVCRNLLIYLGPVLQKKVMRVFHYALKPSGYLVLGASESVGSSVDLFTPIDRSLRIYARKPAPATMNVDFEAYDETRRQPPRRPPLESPADVQRRMDQILLARYTPAAVLVTRDLRILQFRGQTGKFLEHATGTANLNLQGMARGGLAVEVRNLIEALESRKSPIEIKTIPAALEGGISHVRLSVTPVDGLSGEQQYLVVFEDAQDRDEPEKRPSARKSSKKGAPDESRVAELEEELAVTRRYLQTVIEDQEAITEELKSANEEIQSSNEELQSTNEELLTAKEELQSTNEELTTVNEEMQTRNNELVRTNNDLLNLLSSVNIPIVMLGADLKIRRFTPQTERLLNLVPGDVGQPISDFKLKINVPDLEDLVHGVLDNLTAIEREVQDQEGRVFSMWIRPYRTSDNKIDGAVLALFDVTDRKQASDARYRRLFESSRDGIIIADHATGTLLDVNPFACRLIGKARPELLGIPVYAIELLAKAGIRAQTLAEMRENESLRRETSFVREDGEWLDLEILANLYHEGDRRLVQFNIRDVSGRRRAAAEPERSRQLRELEAATRMAASISRNFGNDLTTILVLCDLLLRENPAAPFASDLEKIRDAANRAVALDRQLLAMDRQDTGRKEFVNLNHVLTGILRLLGAVVGDRYTVESHTDPGLRPVEASPAQIERIVLNLLMNARRPGPARGNISVRTANVTIDSEFSAKHPTVKPGEYVSLTVSDSSQPADYPGAGDDPFRLDPARVSGLPAAFEAIHEMGAQVWAFTELGVGSTVQVFFPPAAATHQPEAAAADPAVGSETVLIVDSDRDVRVAAARSLESNGYKVLQAASLDEARQFVSDSAIDLIVADLARDAGHATAEAAQALAAERKGRIAYISSEPDALLERLGVPNHTQMVLRKPFSAEQMARFVRRVLDRKEP